MRAAGAAAYFDQVRIAPAAVQDPPVRRRVALRQVRDEVSIIDAQGRLLRIGSDRKSKYGRNCRASGSFGAHGSDRTYRRSGGPISTGIDTRFSINSLSINSREIVARQTCNCRSTNGGGTKRCRDVVGLDHARLDLAVDRQLIEADLPFQVDTTVGSPVDIELGTIDSPIGPLDVEAEVSFDLPQRTICLAVTIAGIEVGKVCKSF
jgi:hypothetical protein